MKKFSSWAKQHPKTSRRLILLAHLILASIAFLLGAVFFDIFWLSADWMTCIGMGLFFIGLLFYPIKNARFSFFKGTYVRQKSLDALLIVSGFLLVFAYGQQFGQEELANTSKTEWRSALMVDKKAINVSPKASKKAARQQARTKRKQIRKQLKTTIKQIRTEKSDAEKALLLILTLLGAALLTYGLLVLSCSIACSGLEALAVLVGLGGFAGIIILAVMAIKRIFGQGKMQEL